MMTAHSSNTPISLWVKLSHGELKQWNTSVAFSNTFQACHAVFLHFPTNAETVSQLAVFDDLNVDHLWMTFGKGKDLRWIPIHYIVRSLGPRSEALPFFHAFTGCDTVSAFVGKCKKTAWQAWNVFENATEVFHC
jgi:hypothetical protein